MLSSSPTAGPSLPSLVLPLTNHFIPIPFLHLPPEPPANTPLPGSQSLTHSPAPIGQPPSSRSRCYCGLTSLSRACAAASWTLTNSCSGVTLSRSPAWVSVPLTEAVWRGGQASGPASTPCPLPSPPSAGHGHCPVSRPLQPAHLTITLSQEELDPSVSAPPGQLRGWGRDLRPTSEGVHETTRASSWAYPLAHLNHLSGPCSIRKGDTTAV